MKRNGTTWYIGAKDTVYPVDWTGQPPGPWGGPWFATRDEARAELAARLRRSIESARARLKVAIAAGEAEIAEYEARLREVEKS